MISIHINFSNSWPGLLERKHPILNNYGAQLLPTNQILKDEIRRKYQLYKSI